MEHLETHTDGTLWRACTKEAPTKGDKVGNVNIYHPDAKVVRSSDNGVDDGWECPHCGLTWWVEHDG